MEYEISWKKVRLEKLYEDIGLFVSLFGYLFDFPLIFGFISIDFCKYLLMYVYLFYTKLNIEQIKKNLNKRNNSINIF